MLGLIKRLLGHIDGHLMVRDHHPKEHGVGRISTHHVLHRATIHHALHHAGGHVGCFFSFGVPVLAPLLHLCNLLGLTLLDVLVQCSQLGTLRVGDHVRGRHECALVVHSHLIDELQIERLFLIEGTHHVASHHAGAAHHRTHAATFPTSHHVPHHRADIIAALVRRGSSLA